MNKPKNQAKLFGTDGIRGTANTFPVTAGVALRLGMAAGYYFNRGGHRHRVVICKDTRLSGYMLEPALTAGLIAAGVDVLISGPMPTPAVAMLVRSMRADMGIMISASHNPYQDNGIKLFGPDGYKLSDKAEAKIEALMNDLPESTLAKPDKLGRATRLEDTQGRYIEFAKATFPKMLTLEGVHIVLDCAHGAAYQVGPNIFRELGANVTVIGNEPNGFNINQGCGSTAPQAMCEMVRKTGAHIGIALDGDADRVMICDERGEMLDGDQLMAMVATAWSESGRLTGGGMVATVMSNMGLERYLKTLGLKLERTQVGDRYVIERMREGGFNIGGEQSGHIILGDYGTTGDGLVAALQVLAVMVGKHMPLSKCGHVFKPLPQILKNVRFKTGSKPLEQADVKKAIAKAEKTLGKNGRVLVRASGTEPLIRIMIEGENTKQIEALAEEIAAFIA
jgi:phosphoglucosamine mutase